MPSPRLYAPRFAFQSLRQVREVVTASSALREHEEVVVGTMMSCRPQSAATARA